MEKVSVYCVEAFGNVSHSHLRYADSKMKKALLQNRQVRIEPYEPFTMSEKARQLYDELLRYAVFIEDFRGKAAVKIGATSLPAKILNSSFQSNLQYAGLG